MRENLKGNIFNFLILTIYVVITLFSVFHHELWRDEAQVWLIVRDLSFWGILDHVRTEGHPLLWYFLVFPLAKLNLSVVYMQILSVFAMIFAAGFFLWKSPFNKFAKISIIFSAGFLYWLPVISRNYSLIPMFLFGLTYLYPKQKDRPFLYSFFLLLLSQTHVLMSGFCAGLAGLFLYENVVKNAEDFRNKKKYIYSFLIMLFSLLSLFLYISSRSSQNLSVYRFVNDYSVNIYNSFLNLLLNIYGGVNVVVGTFISVLLLVVSYIIFKKNIKIFFVYLFSFIYQFCVYLFVWPTSPEKAFTYLLTIVFCFWIILDKQDFTEKSKLIYNFLIVLVFIFSAPLAFQLIDNDINYDYSGSKKTAEFIKNNIEKDAVIVSNNTLCTSGVMAYLGDRKFYSSEYKEFYSYGFYSQNKPNKFVKTDQSNELKNKKIYYIYNLLEKPEKSKSLVYKSNKMTLLSTEEFYIFED